jgi:hypothetical protein
MTYINNQINRGISSVPNSPMGVSLGLAKRVERRGNPLGSVSGLEQVAMAFGNLGKQTETMNLSETITSPMASSPIPSSTRLPTPTPPLPTQPSMYRPPNIPSSVYSSLTPQVPQQPQLSEQPQQQPIIAAQEGGGIRGLISQSNKDYSVQNQNNTFAPNKAFEQKSFSATPHSSLLSGEGYISNILGGHTVPMGLSNPQQMQKPLEAFPSGGQMNYNTNLQADYSRPQSFYSMPNMNRVT